MFRKVQLLALGFVSLILGLVLIAGSSLIYDITYSPLEPSPKTAWAINGTFYVEDGILLYIAAGSDWARPWGYTPTESEFSFPVNLTVFTPEGGSIIYSLNFSASFFDTLPSIDCSDVQVIAKYTSSLDVSGNLIDTHGNPYLGVVKMAGNYSFRVENSSISWANYPPKLQLYREQKSFSLGWLLIPGGLCLFSGAILLVKGFLLRRRRVKKRL